MISDVTRDKWRTKINTILEAYNDQVFHLNDWELDFMETMQSSIIEQNNDLSWKQSQALNKIYKRIT